MHPIFEKGINSLICLSLAGIFFAIPFNIYLSSYSVGGAWHFFFQQHDVVWLLISIILLFLLKRLDSPDNSQFGSIINGDLSSYYITVAISLFVFSISLLGSQFIYHNFSLSMDEFLAIFQAKIFNQGHLLMPIQEQWREYAQSLQPMWVLTDSNNTQWASSYYPVNSLIQSLFTGWTNLHLSSAIMAAACILLLRQVAIEILGKEHNGQLIAIILLALSPQFLINAMTPYAMTGHLFFNLLWLYLYLKPGKPFLLLALITGFLATGLHQVHSFPAFVAPFIILLIFQKKWSLFWIHAIAYSLALLFWIWWKGAFLPTESILLSPNSSSSPIQHFVDSIIRTTSRHSIMDFLAWAVNLFRFISWQHLLLIPLFFSAMHFRKEMSPVLKALTWSIIISLIPYLVAMPFQGHGWGYRYIHGLLGHVSLLGAFGWVQLNKSLTHKHNQLQQIIRIFSIASLIMLVLALPMRAWQTESVIAPFARSMAYINALQEDIVLIDGKNLWYGQDLIRNSPDLSNSPKVMLLQSLNKKELSNLCNEFSVKLVSVTDLAKFGMQPYANTDFLSNEAIYRSAMSDLNCKNKIVE